MKTCVSVLLLGLLLASPCRASTVNVSAEKTSTVVVSNHQVNRIACASPIQDVIWSKEQPIEVSTRDRNLFVKFLIRRTDGQEHFADGNVDLHVVCDDAIYTLILQPREVDTVTVQLGDPALQQMRESLASWSGLPLEARIKRLTLAMFTGDIPSGATTTDATLPAHLWASTELHDGRRVRLPGVGLSALTFDLSSRDAVTLNERDFLNPELSPSILGVTVDPRELPAGGTARVILIERSQHDAP